MEFFGFGFVFSRFHRYRPAGRCAKDNKNRAAVNGFID